MKKIYLLTKKNNLLYSIYNKKNYDIVQKKYKRKYFEFYILVNFFNKNA